MPLPIPPIVVVQFLFTITALSLVAKWYVAPALRPLPLKAALPPLILPHLIRPISLWLLVPGAIVQTTIPEQFAKGTAYGDLVSAVLALIAVLMLRNELKGAVIAAWTFNVVGFIDVLRNVITGMITQAPTHMAVFALVPAYAVPVIIVSHVLVFKVLLDERRKKR